MTDIEDWFAAQDHDAVNVARTVRGAILAAVPGAVESIKWKAPNYALADDFATLSLRRPGVVQVILHTGAKPKPGHPEIVVDLPRWAKRADRNRIVLTLGPDDDLAPFGPLVADWARQLV